MKIQDIQPIRNPKTGQWDYTGGDHSFSMWWALQCRNIIYSIALIVALVVQSLMIIYYNTVLIWITEAWQDSIGAGIFVLPFLLIPITLIIAVLYGAYYKMWKEFKGE